MVEGKDAAVPRGKENTKRLTILLGILCFLIVGLTVTNVLLLLNNNKGGKESGEEGGEEIFAACSDYWQVTDAVHCVQENYVYNAETLKYGESNCTGICYEYYKTAVAYIESHDSAENVKNIRGIFDEFILAVNDDKSAYGLKLMRDKEISKLDFSDEFNNEMLNDALEADGFFKSVSSADYVIVLAYQLNRQDIIDSYTKIKVERELAEGVDSSKGLGQG